MRRRDASRCRFEICITPIIRDQWNFITAHPQTWGGTLSNYVNSGHMIKKLQMQMKGFAPFRALFFCRLSSPSHLTSQSSGTGKTSNLLC